MFEASIMRGNSVLERYLLDCRLSLGLPRMLASRRGKGIGVNGQNWYGVGSITCSGTWY
jgi:hypothetical protein